MNAAHNEPDDEQDHAPRPTNHPEYVIRDHAVVRLWRNLPLWTRDETPLPIERPQDFRCIRGRWFTDGVHVIVQAQQGAAIAREYYYRIEDADLATFTVLNERYARDAHQAYFITNRTIRTRSPHAFRPLDFERWYERDDGTLFTQMRPHEYYAVDQESIYMNGRRIAGSDGASAAGFEGGYAVDAQRVYYYGKPTDIDRDSFVTGPLDGRLRFTDRLGPINHGKRMTALEHRQIEEWNAFFQVRPHLQDYWWHRLRRRSDAPAVIYDGLRLAGLDAASFATHTFSYGAGWQARGIACGDAHGIHWLHRYAEHNARLERISDQPVTALRELGMYYFTDGAVVFYSPNHYQTPTPLRRVAPATFRVLGEGWACEGSRAFYLGVEKKGVDAQRLHIHGGYAWDDARLFHDGAPLVVDVPHDRLVVPHDGFLRAGDKLFAGRRPISARRVHLPTLEFLSDDFARDAHKAYLIDYPGLTEIAGADPATFRADGPGEASDARRRYDAKALRAGVAPDT
ncbi:DKNYY domain-containing protein [Paraburkholderia bannensis]|uniref:DKNYY domain-containing protein n=1 Tax=Paraburkholderia bannensis TaxID=765414 RepID=UPI002AB6AB7D|nr:DKNYY domain-containing protein [Paraburkholderia bannensis]